MEVQLLSSTVLFNGDPHTKITRIPLTIFDMAAPNMHIAVLFAIKSPTATNTLLKEGLSRTLQHFPTLAGCLQVDNDPHHRPYLLLGGDGGGALVVESRVELTLEEWLPLQPSPALTCLHPPVQGASHLLQAQLNRFACGGLVIGITAHHRVADGRSMGSFFVAWGRSVRDLSIDSLPVYDQTMIKPRNPPSCEYGHWGVEFQPISLLPSTAFTKATLQANEGVQNMLLYYSGEFIEKLKAQLPDSPKKFTTFDALLGHIWRKITKARGIEQEEFTQVRVAVNGRPRLRPMVSMDFFGNLVLNAYPRATAKELLEGSVVEAAGLVHNAVRVIDGRYFQSFIDFGAMNEGQVLVPVTDVEGNALCPNLEVDSWLGLRFEEVDFGGGGGEVCAFMPTWIPMEGVVIFIPTWHGDDKGGVDVVVTLFEDHAQLFKKISHSLD